MAKKGKPKSKVKLTPAERKLAALKRAHRSTSRSVFRNLGFDRVPELAEKTFVFKDRPAEFDDAFLCENLLTLIEYTNSAPDKVGEHLKNKKIIYDLIEKNKSEFISFILEKFPALSDRIGNTYHIDSLVLRIIYCSYNHFDVSIKKFVTEPVYLDFPNLKYFEKISSAIKLSARPEFLQFLGMKWNELGSAGKFPKPGSFDSFPGSLLPEESSGFPAGFKVVSFYADAASLLGRAYVLRRDGWRGSFQAYQRMVQPAKIEAIRRKLKSDRKTFVNNIIAVLPSDAHPTQEDGQTVKISTLKKTSAVTISLPSRSNSIGLIDGQHRLFSYYESRDDDLEIAKLRHQQNLLVTGISYPPELSLAEKERFEAELFLTINSNQTNAPTPLKQEIEVVLNPYGHIAIGKQVMQGLANSGPLEGHVEAYFFDKGKLKTASIVSFGLGPLLKLSGDDSLYSTFHHAEKDMIKDGKAQDALNSYIQYGISTINKTLNAVKTNVTASRWTTDKSVENRLLTVTYINSFLILIRRLVQAGEDLGFENLKTRLQGIDKFKFEDYHSSQYGRMADKILEDHFPAAFGKIYPKV